MSTYCHNERQNQVDLLQTSHALAKVLPDTTLVVPDTALALPGTTTPVKAYQIHIHCEQRLTSANEVN